MSDNTLNPMEKEFTDVANLAELKPGDVVRGKFSGTKFIVTWNYGTRVTAVTSADITNPSEWEVRRPKKSQ